MWKFIFNVIFKLAPIVSFLQFKWHLRVGVEREIPSEFNGQICLVNALFIWNISMELTLKSFFNLSSHRIFLLLLWSCRLFSRIYAQSFLTTSKQQKKAKVTQWYIPFHDHPIYNIDRQYWGDDVTSVLANSEVPTNSWSIGERLHNFVKPPPLLLPLLLALSDLQNLRKREAYLARCDYSERTSNTDNKNCAHVNVTAGKSCSTF
jgi:hypothetical protein